MADPVPHNPNNVDPALLTFREYLDLVNPNGKMHPDSAYDVSLKRLNAYGEHSKSEYPKLLKSVKIKGIQFEFRLKAEPLQYKNPDAIKNGARSHEFTIAVFDEEGVRVASAQDEWNCVLVMVAQEYRGFGLGPILGKIARSLEPDKASGGFTPSGLRNFQKVYREFVRDAVISGKYRKLMASGEITHRRVMTIMKSAGLEQRRPRSDHVNLSTNNPSDWVLYVDPEGFGGFVLYDRKLRDIFHESEAMDHWIDKMIKGVVLVREPSDGKAILVQFGGDTPGIKRFMMSCAITWCANEGLDFWVDPEDVQYVDREKVKIAKKVDLVTGFRRHLVKPEKLIPLDDFQKVEARYRRSFDEFDEFKNTVLERAFSKFRVDNAPRDRDDD